jgi:hypothetical protein
VARPFYIVHAHGWSPDRGSYVVSRLPTPAGPPADFQKVTHFV